ncbi:MAG: ATP-binding protein [Syntrophothermus sp.]
MKMDSFGTNPVTVLIVDDNPTGLYITSKMLQEEKFNIIGASTGKEALKKVELKPDVVILDVKLPDINGFEVCRRIKSNPVTANIPVIHLSATYLDSDSKAQGLDSGADTYLTHPVEPKVLVATINAVLRMRIAEAKLADAVLQWKTTFDSINDGVILIDTLGIISRYNKKFVEITGRDKDSILGFPLSEIMPELARFNYEFFCSLDLSSNKDDIYELEISGRNYSVNLDPVLDISGRCTGFVFKIRDITKDKESAAEIRRTLHDLENLNMQLERSNTELEHFAYAASHDLQEPLRMIASFTKLMGKKIELIDDEKSKEYFDIILEAAVRMQHLIHDLLDYSRITTKGKAFENVIMEEVVQDVLTNLTVRIKESKAKIIIDPLPAVPGNRSQLSQLLQNLISNALKFKSGRPLKIQVGARKDTSDQWIFSVSDNGIGIQEEYYERIFVIFQRLHEREKYDGTGIGLALSKRIVEHHGGTIWVESKPGEGSTFYFSIPARLPSAAKNI